jgi:hypothetical protein
MTAVSNPNSNPPSAATAVLLTNEEEMFMRCISVPQPKGNYFAARENRLTARIFVAAFA